MPGTVSPRALESLLPGVFLEPVDRQEERGGPEFVRGFCAGLDCVLAPAAVTLDCMEAYFDPRLTPPDYLDWLAGWVGLVLDQNWSDEQRRALVIEAGELYRWHGTVRGIIEQIRLYTGVVPEVGDSGGVAWSTTPDADLPGSGATELRVQLTIGPEDDLDVRRLESIVTSVKPAHVPHIIDVVRRTDIKRTPPPPPVPPAEVATQETPPPPTSASGPEETGAPPPSLADGDEGQEPS
jgi:phage tail-like protein